MGRCVAEPGRYLPDENSIAEGAAVRIDFSIFEDRARSKNDGGLMTDIVLEIAHFLTPELVERISSAAELDRASGQMAIEAVVPALLSALVDLADKPGGASRLSSAIAAQTSDTLSALPGNLGELPEFELRGRSVLSALLGTSLVRQMAWIVGSYTGIGERSAKTLMGLLTPIVLGILGREWRVSDLGVEGLRRLLNNERQGIVAAMPSGLNELLEDDLAVDTGPRSASLRWPDSLSPRHSTMQIMGDGVEREAAGGEWSAWALPVLIVLGFVWWYALIWWLLLPSGPTRIGETPRAGKTITATAQKVTSASSTFIANAGDDWISIGGYFNKDIYNRAGERLGTIEDVLIGADGRFNAAVVAINRDLGLGAKNIAIPFGVLHREQHSSGARLVVDTTRDALQNAPAFGARRP
ncbi:MAG TPA: DUF937 domain-containing protein [Hyphomicrobiaceae bacterium]|nr:DUF937 domain-containing protein [Hyphomicrobiaceae bacterium]